MLGDLNSRKLDDRDPEEDTLNKPDASGPGVSFGQTEVMTIVVEQALQSGLDSKDIMKAIDQLHNLPIILGQAIKARAYDLGLTSEQEKWVNLGGGLERKHVGRSSS